MNKINPQQQNNGFNSRKLSIEKNMLELFSSKKDSINIQPLSFLEEFFINFSSYPLVIFNSLILIIWIYNGIYSWDANYWDTRFSDQDYFFFTLFCIFLGLIYWGTLPSKHYQTNIYPRIRFLLRQIVGLIYLLFLLYSIYNFLFEGKYIQYSYTEALNLILILSIFNLFLFCLIGFIEFILFNRIYSKLEQSNDVDDFVHLILNYPINSLAIKSYSIPYKIIKNLINQSEIETFNFFQILIKDERLEVRHLFKISSFFCLFSPEIGTRLHQEMNFHHKSVHEQLFPQKRIFVDKRFDFIYYNQEFFSFIFSISSIFFLILINIPFNNPQPSNDEITLGVFMILLHIIIQGLVFSKTQENLIHVPKKI